MAAPPLWLQTIVYAALILALAVNVVTILAYGQYPDEAEPGKVARIIRE